MRPSIGYVTLTAVLVALWTGAVESNEPNDSYRSATVVIASDFEPPQPVDSRSSNPLLVSQVAANQADEPGPHGGEDDGMDSEDSGQTQAGNQQSRFDEALVQRGQAAFQEACTQCHDAERSLEASKSLSGWLSTVRRMARMDGAEVNPGDIEPIATYLASLSAPADETGDDSQTSEGDGAGSDRLGSSLSVSGTLSTLWRGGNDNIENPNFFVDAWLTADWQPDGPLSGRVTSCTSCHSDVNSGGGFTLELVEASARFDLLHLFREKHHGASETRPKLEAGLKAGRFTVPFGAYAAMSHPGIYRTVTNPLMYNMGRNVNVDSDRPPVLPMPYNDEGANLDVRLQLPCEWSATLDVYAVNGLQGFGPGMQFTPSRSYSDNNSEPAAGGRATIGNRSMRLGGSIMSGRMHDGDFDPLDYRLAGGDATIRFDDFLRVYFEYAIRSNDSDFGRGQIAYGTVSEVEMLLTSEPRISLVTRYDTQEYRDAMGDDSVSRFTWGINTVLPRGSLLIINHEHWNFAEPEADIDLVGIRWVATF